MGSEMCIRDRKNAAFCKADFPKSNVLTDKTVVICRGMARTFKLRVRGRRNAFGLWHGRRTDMWQSGTTPSLAVHFRSKFSHYAELSSATHSSHSCSCVLLCFLSEAAEGDAGKTHFEMKTVSKIAQRVQRESTGYYCGYTFKRQAIGRKYLLKAAQSLDLSLIHI